MLSFRKVLCSAYRGVMEWVIKPRIPCTLVIAAVLLALAALVAMKPVSQAGDVFCVAEPLLFMSGYFVSGTIIMMVCLLLNMDAPFFDGNDAVLIYRQGRLN